jgi:putative Mg2+ transporter-C (MgtC) family protein
VTGPGVAFDPSRVAAQIVSGIGFIGGGIIFGRRDSVQGPTTAVTVWLAAGIGALAGAGEMIRDLTRGRSGVHEDARRVA